MKKIVSMLLLVFLLVGCTPEVVVKGVGGFTEAEIKTMIFEAVDEYEDHDMAVIKSVTWDATDEVVDGIKENLYSVNGQYEWDDDEYKIRLLFHDLGDDSYKLIRYHNITTGRELK